jgi:hypothetical protein
MDQVAIVKLTCFWSMYEIQNIEFFFSHFKWESCRLNLITYNLLCFTWYPPSGISFKKVLWSIYI